jgi:pyruvate ferredoxin oxidoreductase gamma subunit
VFELRVHGRGGQGVVTLAELIATAAFDEGSQAQAFPSFGSERMGAPVMSFCRISDGPITLREPVGEPDAVIVCDATLLHQVAVFSGLKPGGLVLVNSARSIDELGLADLTLGDVGASALSVPATEIARETTGTTRSNGALLGAFAAFSGSISLDAVGDALRGKFTPKVAASNLVAATAAHDFVLAQAVRNG